MYLTPVAHGCGDSLFVVNSLYCRRCHCYGGTATVAHRLLAIALPSSFPALRAANDFRFDGINHPHGCAMDGKENAMFVEVMEWGWPYVFIVTCDHVNSGEEVPPPISCPMTWTVLHLAHTLLLLMVPRWAVLPTRPRSCWWTTGSSTGRDMQASSSSGA